MEDSQADGFDYSPEKIARISKFLEGLRRLKSPSKKPPREKPDIMSVHKRLYDKRLREERKEALIQAHKERVESRECLRCGKDIRVNLEFGLCYKCAILLAAMSSRPLDSVPTLAAPGTEAKVKVLEERYIQGVHLWHPDDLVLDPS